MKRRPNGSKGAVTVEACVAFPIFLCFFLTLIFIIKLVCTDMVLEHTANETAKQLAAAAYPMKFLNELEDETFLDSPSYDIPSFKDELEKAKTNILESVGESSSDIFTMLLTGGSDSLGQNGSLSGIFESISDSALNSMKSGVKGYVTDKLGNSYYEIKSKLKYKAVRSISEKYVDGSYLDAGKLEYAFVQMPQSTVEFELRNRDSTYRDACNTVGYYPKKDDVVVALRYKVKIPIPFVKDRVVILEHIGVERAWLNGSNGVYSRDFLSETVSGSSGTAGNESSVQEDYQKLADETVYVTNTGQKYHKQDCPCLSSSKKPMKLSDAENRGYQKCGVCSNKGKWNFYK